MKRTGLVFATIAALAACASPVAASASTSPTGAQAAAWTTAEAREVLDALDAALGGYVFQDKVPAAQGVLQRNRTAYLAIRDRAEFARRLTEEVGAALDDRHFYVRERAGSAAVGGGSPAERAAAEAETGYGIASVRRLPGNIGYLDLRNFGSSDTAAKRIEAAMDLVQDTGALIIDLRGNRGGGGAAMAALVGRLSSTPIPRSVLIWRNDDGSEERVPMETREYPPAERYARPVYVLTSSITFSAAEAFAYDVQAAGRVTVVGEATRGGANPMNRPLVELGHGLVAFIGNGRSEHPVTKGTANGVGIQPEVRAASADALSLAYVRALEGVAARDPESRFARELATARADPEAALKASFGMTPG